PDAAPDAAPDARPPQTLGYGLNWPIFEAPADPLAGAEVEGCAIFEEARCGVGRTREICDIYDPQAGAFDAAPDPLLRRAYLYDRWYDLHASPDGQTAERLFTMRMDPGTPEAVWADPQYLAQWGGAGDSAIWTGTALNAFILRYLHTGAEADYQRMEDKARVMLRFFEVTRIPGYLSRHHYLLVPEGTPAHPDHIYRWDQGGDDHRDIEDPEGLGFLPDHYLSGVGTPRWSGDPSIDQMNGPMVAFPMVYGLLRDEALKARLAYQMICYLHRLRRIEIHNLQENAEALNAVRQYFAGNELNLDPDDMSFDDINTVVMYVHPQINTQNEDSYDHECGEFIQTTPWRVLDGASPSFIIDLITLAQDMSREENRPNQINHFYIPSLRGGDAVHMMHLTLMAYAFTGDARYARFLSEELLGRIGAAEVAATMSALIPPKFCRKFYGTNIIGGPLWAFNNLLDDDSALGIYMEQVMRTEMWDKECADLGNVNFNLMFAGCVRPEIGGEARAAALREALETLPRFGGNGGILDDPRRSYARGFDEVVAALPEGIDVECPTEAQRAFCEQPIEVFGLSVPGARIAYPCAGASGECVMADGLCTTGAASAPLPPELRRWGDYTWQRSPYDIGETHADGRAQSPGTDYSEQYWMARFYGFIEGAPRALAWRVTEAPCEP
ncbi:hypothetical protein KKF91_16865, partial [Myxococcota bacterium]|nr:hypothetical protein [Myxococcota bacterium]